MAKSPTSAAQHGLQPVGVGQADEAALLLQRRRAAGGIVQGGGPIAGGPGELAQVDELVGGAGARQRQLRDRAVEQLAGGAVVPEPAQDGAVPAEGEPQPPPVACPPLDLGGGGEGGEGRVRLAATVELDTETVQAGAAHTRHAGPFRILHAAAQVGRRLGRPAEDAVDRAAAAVETRQHVGHAVRRQAGRAVQGGQRGGECRGPVGLSRAKGGEGEQDLRPQHRVAGVHGGGRGRRQPGARHVEVADGVGRLGEAELGVARQPVAARRAGAQALVAFLGAGVVVGQASHGGQPEQRRPVAAVLAEARVPARRDRRGRVAFHGGERRPDHPAGVVLRAAAAIGRGRLEEEERGGG